MKTITGKKFCQLLGSQGWQLKRINGSHYIYTKAGVSASLSVPVHGSATLKRGLLKHLMKIAGIGESEL